MAWDYSEVNPFSGSTGDWRTSIEYNIKVLSHLIQIPPVEGEE
jgi:putative DNA methylase